MEAQTALEEMENASKAVLGGDQVMAEQPPSKRQRGEDQATRDSAVETRANEQSSDQANDQFQQPKDPEPISQTVDWMS